MSAKHTPGPWTVRGPSVERLVGSVRHDGGDYAILGADEGIIAEAYRRIGTTNFAPAEENARLIAAAPKLLAAAELAVLNFERHSASGNFLGDDDHEAWTALAEAIADVEGR